MYSENDLKAAVTSGAMSPEAADALRTYVTASKGEAATNEEQFRLINGFNDVFVVIACMILLISVGMIGASKSPFLGVLLVAASSWLLAEFFTLKRRMALPSIVLSLAFIATLMFLAFLFTGLVAIVVSKFTSYVNPTDMVTSKSFISSVSGFFGALAAGIHWRRFQVPISVAAGVCALVVGFFGLIAVFMPTNFLWNRHLLLAAGIAVFIAGVRWDSKDPLRQTRNSDVAFWLHLLAAPLLVHPVFNALGVMSDGISILQATGVVAMYLVIALVSLAINRRALMVSGLGYLLIAMGTLLKSFGLIGVSFAVSTLLLACALLLLSAFWQRSRQMLLELLPEGARSWVAPLHKTHQARHQPQ